MTVHDLPAVNATLNGIATALITTGFVLVKQGRREAHRLCMLTAAGASALFLIGYVAHKALMHGLHTPFGGTGFIRGFYYVMLVSHIVLAMGIAFLVPRTFVFALQGNIDRHRAWARWTFPLWYYVSVTGVLVYFFLYQWWPAGRA